MQRILTKSSTRGFLLRWTFILCSVLFVQLMTNVQAEVQFVEDDEFAEFDFEDEEFEAKKGPSEAEVGDEVDFEDEEEAKMSPDEDEEEAQVEVEEEEDDDEFAHFEDDEEFEGFNRDEDGDFKSKDNTNNNKGGNNNQKKPPPGGINITKVPAHLIRRWENYILELLMVAGIVVYFLNFFTGKSKNQRIATSWFNSHKAMLESNFALVGDDGAKNIADIETQLVKDSEHQFSLWCSGRIGCEGVLIEVKLLKRQDLVNVISNLMKSGSNDQVQIRVNMNPDEMDSFVFALANKRAAAKMSKEMSDINTFCPERRPIADKFGLPEKFVLMSEISEVSTALIDPKLVAMLNKFPDHIESVHFSDQFTGHKSGDDQQQQSSAELPEAKKVMIFTFNILTKDTPIDEATDNMKPLMLLVFYFMDKMKRFRLSREAKHKAEKNRSKVAEAFWKTIHASRAERAQEERERKRRELKEKIREIEDPERQRKMEEQVNRREKKKNAPKMKQMKVKAM